MSYANSNERGTPEALCPMCTPIPFNITRLRYVRTILAPESVMIFYCPKCRKEYHEYQVIFSNYTWLYIEEEKESEKQEWGHVLFVVGKNAMGFIMKFGKGDIVIIDLPIEIVQLERISNPLLGQNKWLCQDCQDKAFKKGEN